MNNLYELFRLEVTAGEDLKDSDPAMLQTAFTCNLAVKDFLAQKLKWCDLLDILDYFGVNVDEYAETVENNLKAAGVFL